MLRALSRIRNRLAVDFDLVCLGIMLNATHRLVIAATPSTTIMINSFFVEKPVWWIVYSQHLIQWRNS